MQGAANPASRVAKRIGQSKIGSQVKDRVVGQEYGGFISCAEDAVQGGVESTGKTPVGFETVMPDLRVSPGQLLVNGQVRTVVQAEYAVVRNPGIEDRIHTLEQSD